MSAGIFAGPERPKKLSSTSLPWPDSTTVGTSGASGERCADVTASGLIWPLLKNGTKAVMTSMPTGITPEIRSVVIGAPPRYGTCVILMPMARLHHLAVDVADRGRARREPNCSGRRLRRVLEVDRCVLMPVAGLAITTQGAEPIDAMWVKSAIGS